MSQQPFKTPEFLKLFREWNQRLKEDGFVDAEDFSLPEPPLKVWHSLKWEGDESQKREAASKTYYELASELLHNGFPFKNDVHRRTWELHCTGMSIRKIQKALHSQMLRYRGLQRKNIHEIIVLVRKSAGIKNE